MCVYFGKGIQSVICTALPMTVFKIMKCLDVLMAGFSVPIYTHNIYIIMYLGAKTINDL